MPNGNQTGRIYKYVNVHNIHTSRKFQSSSYLQNAWDGNAENEREEAAAHIW